MSDDAALIAPNIEALKALAEQCSATDTLPMLTARELLALCALAERVPQLELIAKRQEEMDEERAQAVRQVAAMEGALPFCRRQVEALKGRAEQAEARVAEQTIRTHEYIDLHAAAARNNAALRARVAALVGALEPLMERFCWHQVKYHQRARHPDGHTMKCRNPDCVKDNELLEATRGAGAADQAPRRDADGTGR